MLSDGDRRAVDGDRFDHGAESGATRQSQVDDRVGAIDAAAGPRQHALEHDVDGAG